MSYTSILVHACPDRSRMARLRCATELAGEFQATIIGVGAEALEPIGLSEDVTTSLNREWFDVTRERVVEHLKAAKANFTDVVGDQPHEWRSEWSDPTIAVTRAAIAADLIVSGGECVAAESVPYPQVDTGALIVASGRPVLYCPAYHDRLSRRPVLIAWKDTREARRAGADALPLLKRAQSVTVLEICEPDELESALGRATEVAAGLARHGVHASPESIARSGSTSDTLLAQADDRGVGLIVAGAYGHSRLGEWVFGGVTRRLLRQARHFVLFSH